MSTTLRVINPKANKFFDLNEEGMVFIVGDKSVHLSREETVAMLLGKYTTLPPDRKPNKEKEYRFRLNGSLLEEAI